MKVIEEEKKELLNWIKSIDDPKLLEDLQSVRESQNALHWGSLPNEVKEGIEQGRKDAKEGKVTSHDEVRKSYEKRL